MSAWRPSIKTSTKFWHFKPLPMSTYVHFAKPPPPYGRLTSWSHVNIVSMSLDTSMYSQYSQCMLKIGLFLCLTQAVKTVSRLMYIHTHPFNGPFSGTTRVSRYQKGKTYLDFTEARDSEWQWHQLGHMQDCTSLQTDNHASTPPLSFLQAGCPSCRPANSVKALRANVH